jgi:DHA1 family bicyclomycin/chloramphenicol resistance-like MFS transporter
MHHSHQKVPWRFVALMAALMSFVALSIDSILPALSIIGNEFNVHHENDVQLIISFIFFGMGFGLLFFGPISDSFGRKFSIILGMSIFMAGCFLSMISTNIELMLIGRLLQGFGGASCRVVTIAMVRDRFDGFVMAKIMSFITIIFILVPAIAPSIGLAVLFVTKWNAIFGLMLVLAIICTFWLHLGQEETLEKENRLPFKLSTIINGAKETCGDRNTMMYTWASGFSFGAFVAYLGTSQQILQYQYELGDLFPLTFGVMGLFIGVSSFINTRLVEKMGMQTLCFLALVSTIITSVIFLLICLGYEGQPPLAFFLTFIAIIFLSFGLFFGNINTLAMQPFGHIAGIANTIITSIQTILSAMLGSFIGLLYDHTLVPLAAGFLILNVLAFILTTTAIQKTLRQGHQTI